MELLKLYETPAEPALLGLALSHEIARKRVALIEAQPLLFNEANVSLHYKSDYCAEKFF